MSRKRLKEELIWGVATLLAALLCLFLAPLLFVSWLAELLRGVLCPKSEKRG